MTTNPKHIKAWEQLIRFFDFQENEDDIIQKTPQKYKLLVALAVSCSKWAAKSSKSDLHKYVIFCGLCELYHNCEDCPLTKVGQECGSRDSLWEKYSSSNCCVQRRKHSKKMFDTLVDLYIKEYEKVMR